MLRCGCAGGAARYCLPLSYVTILAIWEPDHEGCVIIPLESFVIFTLERWNISTGTGLMESYLTRVRGGFLFFFTILLNLWGIRGVVRRYGAGKAPCLINVAWGCVSSSYTIESTYSFTPSATYVSTK